MVKNRLLDSELYIYQDEDWFKFSIDSVLLAHFVTVNLRCKRIMDLACGNAPIPMFLSYRTNALIYGVEFQKCVYDLGVKSVLENHLDEQIKLVNDDVRELNHLFESDSFDVVTCNPPYFKVSNDEFTNSNSVKAIARHEIHLNLEDVLRTACYLLKNGGIFAMVHRTERLIEIIDIFKKYHIEPKRIQFIYPKASKNSDLFLIEGIKNGKTGLKMLSPLVIHKNNDEYTDVVQDILNFTNRGE